MKRNWRDKVSADCIRQLEYHRLSKAFFENVPDSLPELFKFATSGGFDQFNKDTGDLLTATPEHYEEVELGDELVQFVNVLWPDAPWGTLTPHPVRLPPNGARIVRQFQELVLLFETEPKLRGFVYLAISFFGTFAVQKIQGIAEKSNLPEFTDIVTSSQKGDLRPALEAAGKILEHIGKSLQGKPIPKGKIDREKTEVINLIRENEKQRLSWDEVRDALEFGGIYFKDAENLRIFAYRVSKRKNARRSRRA